MCTQPFHFPTSTFCPPRRGDISLSNRLLPIFPIFQTATTKRGGWKAVFSFHIFKLIAFQFLLSIFQRKTKSFSLPKRFKQAKNSTKMAPNAILSSLLTTVFHQQQHTQQSASSSSPASAEMATSAVMAVNLPQLRRSPPCFGGQCATVWMAAGNLTTGSGKQQQKQLKQTPPICPAPASQVGAFRCLGN